MFTPQQAKAHAGEQGVIEQLSSKMDVAQGNRPLPSDVPFAAELLSLWNRIIMQLLDKCQCYKTDYPFVQYCFARWLAWALL